MTASKGFSKLDSENIIKDMKDSDMKTYGIVVRKNEEKSSENAKA